MNERKPNANETAQQRMERWRRADRRAAIAIAVAAGTVILLGLAW